jgi:hypothetical protein
MASNVKVTTTRAPSAVSQQGLPARIASQYGTRYAIARRVKRQLPGGRWEPVVTWTCKQRNLQSGRPMTMLVGVDEATARDFVGA